MILLFILNLFLSIFNNSNFIDKKVYFDMGNNKRLVLNVTNIYVEVNDNYSKK